MAGFKSITERTGSSRDASYTALQYRLYAIRNEFRKTIAAVLCFGIVLSFLQLSIPLYSMQIFDKVLPSGQLPTLLALSVIVGFVVLLSTVIDACRSLILVNSAQRLADEFDVTIVTASLGGKRSRSLMDDLDTLTNFLRGQSVLSVFDAPWSLLYVVALSLVNVWLGLYTAVSIAVVGALAASSEYFLIESRNEGRRLALDLGDVLRSEIHDARELTAIGVVPGIIRQVTRLRQLSHRNFSERLTQLSWFNAGSRTVRSLLQIGVMTLSATLTLLHYTNAGAIVASSMLFTRSIAPTERLTSDIRLLKLAFQAWSNINAEVMSGPLTETKLRVASLTGAVRASCASVMVESRDRPILSNINLDLEPGLLYVIVGPEGSGKSALAKLLCGGLVATTGFVHFDHMESGNYDQEALSSGIGYLPERPIGRKGTISSLICREGDCDDELVVAAAQSAGVDTIIRGLSLGYQSIIYPSSNLLSAGQLKRLALARAIYKHPMLLVLDEPMNGLDGSGEDCVLSIIQSFKDLKRTVVVVARSPRLLQMADKLILLEDGEVVLTVNETSLASFIGPRGVV